LTFDANIDFDKYDAIVNIWDLKVKMVLLFCPPYCSQRIGRRTLIPGK
jgi:hypothetical protein